MRNLTALGWTEEVTACDCCGKSELSGTMALECQEAGEVVYYGSVCAKRNTGRKTLQSEATARLQRLQREFDARRAHLPEVQAFNTRAAEGHRVGIEPGKAFKAFIGAAGEAMRAAENNLRTELGLGDAWKRRAA
jgi:hypothetical protein